MAEKTTKLAELVTREDAVRFLEYTNPKWSAAASEASDDIEDVRWALASFVASLAPRIDLDHHCPGCRPLQEVSQAIMAPRKGD